jgi:tRNA G18 (ribose-2'-O)-methylase SpoU
MCPESIAAASDPRVDDYRALPDSDLRARGLFIAEGHLAVSRLLRSPRFATRSVLGTDDAIERLRDDLRGVEAPVRILTAPPQLIRQIVGFKFHRGCLAAGERGVPLAPARVVDPPGPRTLVAIESLVDPENVGAVFRNAMAFGVDAVLLSPDCADALGRKALRASAGGALRVPFASPREWIRGLTGLQEAGYHVLALAPDGDLQVLELGRSHPFGDRVALLVGHESRGLSVEARSAARASVRIAMASGVDSLNAATACGIALYHLWTRRA